MQLERNYVKCLSPPQTLTFPSFPIVILQVYIDDSTMEAAFILVQAAGMFTLTALAASLWVAVKLLAVRSTSPCRQLVCMASGIDPPELSSAELGLCKHLNWNMSRIVREAGIVC